MHEKIVLSVLLAVIGIIFTFGLVWFAYTLIKQNKRSDEKEFYHPAIDDLLHHWALHKYKDYDLIPRLISDSYSEYLQRRNDFWTAYGQVLLAILIVIVLAILLITKTISAEAGLPILSGISGFAIAKGASAAKTSNNNPGPRRFNE
ncbi:hypothetical protein [Planctobacterium marinum]|uniref:Uncharacterized protein n=1 Tax=Planctobacterium marinum TaxID=1631968 RepID=A0AA48HXP0_9ALTE|nr:hypothetical protein MACH26_20260 [Planctobacterium marinum]